jgi:tripartite ATP-independent transporter DctP family solute receptor
MDLIKSIAMISELINSSAKQDHGRIDMRLARTLGALTAAAMIAAAAAPAMAQVKLTVAHHNAIGSQNTTAVERFRTCAEAGGLVSIAHYPAGQLGTAREIVEQLKLGAVDVSLTDTAYMSNLQPELAVFQLPFMFTGWEHAEKAMDGPPGRTVAETLVRSQGVRPLAYMHNGFRDFMTTAKPIRTVADFKGMKLRSPPIPIWVRMFEALEANPVTVDWTEVYQAMQSGLVEGMEAPAEGFVNSKSFEVAKHVTRSGHMYNLMMLVVNERRFQGLTEPQRARLSECGAAFRKTGNPEVVALTDEAYAFLAARGIQIHEIDKGPLRQRLETAWGQLLGNAQTAAKPLMDQIAALR